MKGGVPFLEFSDEKLEGLEEKEFPEFLVET